MSKITVYLAVGARPNFMKIAPLMRELEKHSERFTTRIVHAGQHYDPEMSGVFFKELGIPAPAWQLGAGSGTHAEQTGRIMVAFEKTCIEDRPSLVLVIGDVNTTIACAIAARKLGIHVGHVEAGLRCGDRCMPEEINRVATDSICDLFFVTEKSGVENLLREGKSERQIHLVGNLMIDNLLYQVRELQRPDTPHFPTTALKRRLGRYGVLTLHRAINVDDRATLARIMDGLGGIAEQLPLIFPVHPRTRANLEKFRIRIPDGCHVTGPLPYREFLDLWKDAAMVLTDSGGIQEETTGLGVPCLTLREDTERPITISEGTNILVGTDPVKIANAVQAVLLGKHVRETTRVPFWDGYASQRIARVLLEILPVSANSRSSLELSSKSEPRRSYRAVTGAP